MNASKHTSIETPPNLKYIGRFAPSPSGRLHFGSLVSAVASYCDAKAHRGKWLVRIENLDPPREETCASQFILNSLESHGLFWDDTALYQSQRLGAYQESFEDLNESIYACGCTRQRILSLNGRYDGHCQQHTPASNTAVAWRLNTKQHPHLLNLSENFEDIFLNHQHLALDAMGDFMIRRKDTLFSYQLAVAIDDLFQQITHVIRGQDLIDSTYKQRYLLLLLQSPQFRHHTEPDNRKLSLIERDVLPQYGHTPLALGNDGHKLSKQAKAKPIDDSHCAKNLMAALAFLGHPPPNIFLTDPLTKHLAGSDDQHLCIEILNWAIANWTRDKVPKDSAVAPTQADA